MKQREKLKKTLVFAFCVAFFPPFWAVAAPFIGVNTGPVALISAGIYAASGNRSKDALRVSLGLLAGDVWSVFTIWLIAILQWPPAVEQYLILFVLGGMAVIFGEMLDRIFDTPAWLGGWAVGLTIMGSLPPHQLGTLPLQIGGSMLVGIYGIGVGVGAFQSWLLHLMDVQT